LTRLRIPDQFSTGLLELGPHKKEGLVGEQLLPERLLNAIPLLHLNRQVLAQIDEFAYRVAVLILAYYDRGWVQAATIRDQNREYLGGGRLQRWKIAI